jgi:hypothetical protein
MYSVITMFNLIEICVRGKMTRKDQTFWRIRKADQNRQCRLTSLNIYLCRPRSFVSYVYYVKHC